MQTIKALDTFAGTGWGVACKWLDIEEDGVEIMPEAVATRDANGMTTIYRDVWDGILLSKDEHEARYGTYDLKISSPPCQTFSVAGAGAGRRALDEVIRAIQLHAYKDPAELLAFGEKHDMRTALVLTPLAYIWRDMPRLVALEQVPTVLPVWEAYAEIMTDLGYSVKTAILNAEQYGVPQTRRRAILVARLDGDVQLPRPTHSRYYSRTPEKLDSGVAKWVSMADALGWDNGQTFTQNNKLTNQARRTLGHPAPTITAGHDSGNRGFLDGEGKLTVATPEQVASLQSYPSMVGFPRLSDGRGGDVVIGGEAYRARDLRPADEPALTITEKARSWKVFQADGTERRLTTAEAGVIQTYERPFEWRGAKTKQFLQIGNAVPPILARAVLSALIADEVELKKEQYDLATAR